MGRHTAKGTAEAESARMAAVLNASYPKGWRFRTSYLKSSDGRYLVWAHIERFNGVYWRSARSISGDWAPAKDAAFGSMLASWAGKGSWTETVRSTTLPWPQAASTEELCLKLSLLEGAGEGGERR